MNYYKRLWKNRPAAIWLLLALGILGFFIIYAGVNEILFSLDGVKDIWGVFLGFIFIFYGIYVMYWSLISGPQTSAYALDKDDFNVKTKGEYAYIKYKKYEIIELKDNIKNNCFKDRNGLKIRYLDKKRIYNAMIYLFPGALERALRGKKEILLSQIHLGFEDKKELSNEEKIEYTKKRKIKKRLRIITMISSVILAVLIVVFNLKYIPNFEIYYNRNASYTFFLFFMLALLDIILIYITKLLFSKAFYDINRYNKIMQRRVYSIGCTVWDKAYTEYTNSEDGNIYHYYIKVADERYVCSQWIEIPEATYKKIEKDNITEIRLIVLEDKDYPIHDVIVD